MTRDGVRLTGALAGAVGRELVRDRATMLFTVVFPAALLGLMVAVAGGAPGAGDPLGFALPGVIVFGFVALAVHGTAAPLVMLRSQGTLRLLATTPVPRLAFVLAQMPVRFLLAGVQVAAAVSLALARDALRPGAVVTLCLTLVLGLWLLVAFGFLAGGVMRSPESVTSGLGAAMPVLLLLSGVFIPLELLPDALRAAAYASPLFYFTDAIRHAVGDTAPVFPFAVDLLATAAAAAALTVLAAATFRWDQGEPV